MDALSFLRWLVRFASYQQTYAAVFGLTGSSIHSLSPETGLSLLSEGGREDVQLVVQVHPVLDPCSLPTEVDQQVTCHSLLVSSVIIRLTVCCGAEYTV